MLAVRQVPAISYGEVPQNQVTAAGKTVSRSVVPDAIPIMILRPFSPIRYVYELENTEPRIDREAIKDPFAAKGNFDPRALPTLIASLQKQKRFQIMIRINLTERFVTIAPRGSPLDV